VVSIAELVSTLRTAGDFRDVQLRQYFEDDRQGQVNFRFNLDCVYRPPSAAVPSAPVTGPPARRGT
jgi:hypothetical protein